MTPALRWTLVVAVEALLILLLLPFGFVYTASLPVHQFQMVALGATGIVGWALVIVWPRTLPLTVLLAPIPLLVTMAMASLVSAYPTLSWPATWQVAAYTGIFWLFAAQAGHPDGRRNLIAVIGLVALVGLASYFAAVALAWRDWLGLGFSITTLPLRPAAAGGFAIIPTWFADLMALAIPLVMAQLHRSGRTITAGALGAVAMLAIVLSGTRSVLLLLLAGIVFGLLLAIGVRRGGRSIAITGVVAVALAAAGGFVLIASARSFDEGRFSAYASGINRTLEFPVLGGGPGTYGVRRLHEIVDSIGHLAFPDAHNIVLTTAAETGLIGLFGLLLCVALYGIATRYSWRNSPADRPLILGALFGLAIVAGHGMVDVIFGLIGITILALAVAAVAASSNAVTVTEPASTNRRLWSIAPPALGLVVVVASSIGMLRTETTLQLLDRADRAFRDSPETALSLATQAAQSSPDSAPAWWVRMVVADALGDRILAIDAARRLTRLEGFGQQWTTLAVLSWRAVVPDRGALRMSIRGPTDPLVELNAAVLFNAQGNSNEGDAAVLRLFAVQPDIEPSLQLAPQTVWEAAARLRPEAANRALAAGDVDSALLIALSGEDAALAQSIITRVAANESDVATSRNAIVDAWFGNAAARSALEERARASPSLSNLIWSWRVAVHACDRAATDRWELAAYVGYGYVPRIPTYLGIAPDFQAWMLPTYYPSFLWRLDHPQLPYVTGTYSYSAGRPDCVAHTPAG